MNSMIVTSVKGEPKSSPTRDEFRRIGGIGALKLAARADQALIAAQIRRETGNPESARELALICVREYRAAGRDAEARLAANAFQLTAEEFESVRSSPTKPGKPDYGVGTFTVGERFLRSNLIVVNRRDCSAPLTDADKAAILEDSKHILASSGVLIDEVGQVLALLEATSLLGKKREVAEGALEILKNEGKEPYAYRFFFAMVGYGFFEGMSAETFDENRAPLLVDSLMRDMRNGHYENVLDVISKETTIPYGSLYDIHMLASIIKEQKARILNVPQEFPQEREGRPAMTQE